ncbi:MAG: elongator complex protein 3 [Desulfonatronovibrio sp.]
MFQFKHPEPTKTKKPVWPVFIPFAGCPFRCIYCSQFIQTGQTVKNAEQTAREMTEGIAARYRKTGEPVSLGFFGGTFTAMHNQEMIFYLKKAWQLKRAGAVDHLRCSTRPDCIDEQKLTTLGEYGVDMIELGIQSFDHKTLKLSNRRYSCTQAVQACKMVKGMGFELGIQLLPGLPGSGSTAFKRDIALVQNIAPNIVRIYPCLVLKDTPLAEKMRLGQYKPWSLETTTQITSQALLDLWQENIPVIRLGLAPEKTLLKNILAGPWHPSLGALCRSAALKVWFLSQLAKTGGHPCLVYIPEKYASDFWGYKQMNAKSLAAKGITRKIVRPWKKDFFRVYFS